MHSPTAPDAGRNPPPGGPEGAAGPRSRKGEETREKILSTALALFRERGYDLTTMRAVAESAGVSLGSAYYYFESKEHLIQAFYAQSCEEFAAKAAPLLVRERSFGKRVQAVLLAKIESDEPHHRFSGVLFRTAADPESPLNPFSRESAPVRLRAMGVWSRVVEGSDFRPGKDLAPEVPHLLWMLQMGVTLFWIFDRSPSRRRTRELISTVAPFSARLLQIASFPVIRPFTKRSIAFLRRMREDTSRGQPPVAEPGPEA